MKKLVLFGAGNIGRSFIGQLFSKGAYEVVFIDIDTRILDALNKNGGYDVVIKENNADDEIIHVENIRAVDARDTDRVSQEIETASLIATAVGKGALGAVSAAIADGISRRINLHLPPIDILLAENVRGVASWMKNELTTILGKGVVISDYVGFVETSIGKMVPIMSDRDRGEDPVQVFAERYNTLIVDAHGFKGTMPRIEGIEGVPNITAYVDRKLFIHNLGHASAAYVGNRMSPDSTYLYQVLADADVFRITKSAMLESADALAAEYPAEFRSEDLYKHVEDLLIRFKNRALKDTVFRVGRDVPRKLSREDRLIGAMLLAAEHRLPFGSIAQAAACAFSFHAVDERGLPYPADADLAEKFTRGKLRPLLRDICGLSEIRDIDRAVISHIETALEV